MGQHGPETAATLQWSPHLGGRDMQYSSIHYPPMHPLLPFLSPSPSPSLLDLTHRAFWCSSGPGRLQQVLRAGRSVVRPQKAEAAAFGQAVLTW